MRKLLFVRRGRILCYVACGGLTHRVWPFSFIHGTARKAGDDDPEDLWRDQVLGVRHIGKEHVLGPGVGHPFGEDSPRDWRSFWLVEGLNIPRSREASWVKCPRIRPSTAWAEAGSNFFRLA